MKPVKILLIADEKPGHITISEGIAQSIKNHRPIKIFYMKARLKSSIFRPLLTWLLNNFNFKSKKTIQLLLDMFYTHSSLKEFTLPDLIISTGGNTSFANILLSSYWSVPNIYCSSLRGLKPKLFSRIFSGKSHHWENEVTLELMPSKIPNTPSKEPISNEQYWALLIGGNSNEYSYTLDDHKQLVETLAVLAKTKGAKLLITTSRRTDPKAENILQEIAKKHSGNIEKLVLFHKKPEKVVGSFLAKSKIVFCTEDSGSMITEAILSQRKVYSLWPKKRKLSNNYKLFLEKNIIKNYLFSIPIEKINSITFQESFSKLSSNPYEQAYESIVTLLSNSKERSK